MEILKSNLPQISQDALSNECVKQEPCDFPPREQKNAPQLLERKQSRAQNTRHCSYLFGSLNDEMLKFSIMSKDASTYTMCTYSSLFMYQG